MMKDKDIPEIPLHTKWGFRVTVVIVLFLTVVIVKNCTESIRYGVSTEQELQQQFYDLGYLHGSQRAEGMPSTAEPETDNLLLKKMYRKGYRDGWDSGSSSENK